MAGRALPAFLLIPADEATSTRFFRRFVMEGRGPSLELACGTGRPMLEFVADGFDVEGLDASQDMLDRCRRKASALKADLSDEQDAAGLISAARDAHGPLDLLVNSASVFENGVCQRYRHKLRRANETATAAAACKLAHRGSKP